MSAEYTDDDFRNDHRQVEAILEKQGSLRKEQEELDRQLRDVLGRSRDHQSGFRHKPELCETCRLAEGT